MTRTPVTAAEGHAARRRSTQGSFHASDASDALSGDSRAVLDGVTTEKQWQDVVIHCAKANRWLVYHVFDARKSEPGFPDLCCVHPERKRILFLELKRERGRVRPEQEVWIAALNATGRVEARIVRPSDWEWVRAVLSGEEVRE